MKDVGPSESPYGGRLQTATCCGSGSATVPVPDQAVALCGRGMTEQRRQRLAGQGAPRPEIGGVGDAPTGFGLGDPQPVG